METKTKLQQTVETLAAQIAYAIEDAMAKGEAKVNHYAENGIDVDGLCLFTMGSEVRMSLILNSEKIKRRILTPEKKALKLRKERLEAELEKVNNQLKEIQQ